MTCKVFQETKNGNTEKKTEMGKTQRERNADEKGDKNTTAESEKVRTRNEGITS